MESLNWQSFDAVLFDLDGVLTPTAEVHMRAWSEMFNAFLIEYADRTGEPQPPYTDEDYFAHVDGKPRYDGVRDFLSSRGIDLPEGTVDDPDDALTVHGLGNRKNTEVNVVLERDGVEAYPGSVALLDHLRELGLRLAVVSSSANAPTVLAAARLSDRFETVVDGKVSRDEGLAGKPRPDTFVRAAELVGASVERSVVVEDAVSGVQAGAAGGFGAVVGVDRGAGSETLTANGATVVVTDLAELI